MPVASWKVQVLAWLQEWRPDVSDAAAMALERLVGVGSVNRADFDEFWRVYPRKIAKGAAWSAWQTLQPDAGLVSRILASVRDHQAQDVQWQKDGGQFIPHPATFLNQRRFEDELTVQPRLSEPVSRLAQAVADFSKLS